MQSRSVAESVMLIPHSGRPYGTEGKMQGYRRLKLFKSLIECIGQTSKAFMRLFLVEFARKQRKQGLCRIFAQAFGR